MSDATNNQPKLSHDARGKRPTFYETSGVDQLMSMVMVLASELTVLRDRLDAQERVAKLHGIDLAAGIDTLQLDEVALQERERWRQSFLDRLFYMARKESAEAAMGDSQKAFNSTIADIAAS